MPSLQTRAPNNFEEHLGGLFTAARKKSTNVADDVLKHVAVLESVIKSTAASRQLRKCIGF